MSNVVNVKSANELEAERVLGLIYEIANRIVESPKIIRTNGEFRQLNDSLESGKVNPIQKLSGHMQKLN
jgi:hypothetical protein